MASIYLNAHGRGVRVRLASLWAAGLRPRAGSWPTELQVHVAPMLLGGGVRLFGEHAPGELRLERMPVVDSPAVTHLRYRVVK